MKISFAGLTDVGRKRERNEDNYRILEENDLMILCDGMGGLNAGNVASQTAVDTISDLLRSGNDKKLNAIFADLPTSYLSEIKNIIGAIRLANKRIFNKTATIENREGQMGTTVEVVQFTKNHIIIGHVGDSRVYRLRNYKLEQLTKDHSWINELLQDNEITKEEAENFRARNVITRALGVKPNVKIDIIIDDIQVGDFYLLCSDGLTGPVNDKLITQIMTERPTTVEKISEKLIKTANQNGGHDNITVALARIDNLSVKNFPISKTRETIAEESAAIQKTELELLQSLYGKTPQKTSSPWKKIAFALCAIVIAAIVAWQFLAKNETETIESTEVKINQETPTPPPAPVQQEGKIRFAIWKNKKEKMEADIFVDGHSLGKVKDYYQEGLLLQTGSHDIKLILNSHVIYQHEIDISTSMEKTIEID